jgi:hypothetical protein
VILTTRPGQAFWLGLSLKSLCGVRLRQMWCRWRRSGLPWYPFRKMSIIGRFLVWCRLFCYAYRSYTASNMSSDIDINDLANQRAILRSLTSSISLPTSLPYTPVALPQWYIKTNTLIDGRTKIILKRSQRLLLSGSSGINIRLKGTTGIDISAIISAKRV